MMISKVSSARFSFALLTFFLFVALRCSLALSSGISYRFQLFWPKLCANFVNPIRFHYFSHASGLWGHMRCCTADNLVDDFCTVLNEVIKWAKAFDETKKKRHSQQRREKREPEEHKDNVRNVSLQVAGGEKFLWVQRGEMEKGKERIKTTRFLIISAV